MLAISACLIIFGSWFLVLGLIAIAIMFFGFLIGFGTFMGYRNYLKKN